MIKQISYIKVKVFIFCYASKFNRTKLIKTFFEI